MRLALLILGFYGAFAIAERPVKCEPLIASSELERRLAENDFEIRRGLNLYDNMLTARGVPRLSETLASLRADDLYVDVGAGVGLAAREAAERFDASVVAIGFQKPEDEALEKDLQAYGPRFRYLDGGHLEDIIKDPSHPLFELREKASASSEIIGPTSYTRDLAATFSAHADLLKVGGQAFIYFPEGATHFRIETADGKSHRLTLRQLASLIPVATGGRLQVREARMRLEGAWPQFEETVLWLEKVSVVSVGAIDPFLLESIVDDAPPIRHFLVDLPFAIDPVESRALELAREKTRFQKATVTWAFEPGRL